MSIGRPNIPRIVDQDTYAQNQEFIRQAEERLRVFKEMNEKGREEYEHMLELKKKVKEGEEARRLLESMTVSRPQIAAPPIVTPVVEPTSNTTRIEELGAHQPHAHSGSYAQAPDPRYNGNAYPSSTSQSASGSGPSNPQGVYPAAGPSHAPIINSTHSGYTHTPSAVSMTPYGPAFPANNNPYVGNPTTSYQDVASMQNQPRARHASQQQQQVANMSVDPNRAQTNTQNTPVQVYTPVIQLNPPRSTTNIVKPSDIVSLISIPEVENIYQRTLSWIQEVPLGSYCELPHSQCSVYKNEDGRIYIQIPPINGLPQTLPVSDFFEKWKLLIATATRHMQNNPSQSGPSQPTQTPQSNPTIVMPQLPQTNLPQVSTHVDSRPRGVGSSSQSQPQPPRPPPLHNQQPPQPRSSQPHPQRLPQHHPPQLPQTQHPQHYKAQPPEPQPRPQTQSQVQPPNLQQPVLGTQTQLLQQAIVQAQSQINSRPQNYTAQPEPQPSASAQESNAIAPEGSRNSPDIVQITLPKRRAPGDADKKRLAKDLLFALGKRVRPDAPADRPSEGSSKKHVSEQMVQSSSSLASALDYNIAYKAAQASTRSAVSSGPNVAPTSGSSFHTFSIAGPISGSVSYVQASTASSAILMSTKAPQHLYPIVNTVNTAPPGPPVTQATTSEVVGTPNPKPSTPTAPVNTGASSGAAAASSIEIASVPPSPSTDLGQNPYRVLLTTTTNTIPRASVPIVPQRSSHESSTPVAQPTTAPLTASKDGAIATGPSVTSPATLPIALSSASTSQVSGEQQEEPLFLPGTPEQDESDIEIIEQPTKVVKKPVGRKVVNRAYVLIPKPSAKIRRLMQRKSAPSDVRSSHRNFMVVSETESEEDFSVPLESINVIDKAAQEAIRLSASRIEVLPCKWDGCDVVTNCPQTLINHLEKSHKSHRAHFTCLWTQCGRRCHQNENHLEKHASIPYRCAYKGCTETFRSGSTLLKHFRRYHKGGELKPSARPVAMGLKPIPKTPTEPLPAYLCLSRVAQPTPITSKQHASLGPWVLRNINESDTSQTWQKKKTSRYNESTPGGNPGADYEYLITRTLRPSSYLSTPAHVELADIGMNSEFYEGQRYDESLTIFNRRQPGEDEVEELNSPNSPLFGLNAKAKEVIDISQDHDEGDG